MDDELDELFEEYSGVSGISADRLGTLIRDVFDALVDSIIDSCTDTERA